MNMQVPAHIQNRQRRNLAETARTGLGRGVPYLSIEGGAFTLIDENGQQRPVPTPYVDCVIIDVTNVVGRVFWGMENEYGGYTKNYSRNNPVPPVCFSDNGIGASNAAADPQATNCKGCQWSVWGSAKSRQDGKPIPACGSTKKIALYYPDIQFPFLLRIPVMSHDNFKNFLSLFVGQDFDVSDVWCRVSFVHGVQGVLQFEATSKYDPNRLWVDDATFDVIDTILEHRMTDQLVGRGDVPWQGPVAGIAGPAATEQRLAPPPLAGGVLQGTPVNPPTSPPFGQVGTLQGASQGGFGRAPAPQGGVGQTAQPGASTAPAQTGKRGRGRPKNPAPQNPAQVGVSPAANSGFTAPPATPAPATAAPFGGGAIASGAAPSSEMGNALNSAFGLPVGGR